ncbi:uncharacterized protein N7483_008186 [Penicillium malachiteum]|uniref:uncharacterized protein n=1 Tax=Penicillium malachiteum TaxID=1324776 RepID=UPI002549129E|nr:uncharacterized protein N7483_008186 [Penicillium malachiteum]KAJ5720252.1 hypothetical protein N7483_008186 [Penicillium malachiteum]
MCFDSLPTEILFLIGSQLQTINDLFNLSRANRMLFNLFVNELYKANVRCDGGSALVWYSSQGNEPCVKRMLAAGADVNVRSPRQHQSTALLEAVSRNHKTLVQILLEKGAAPDASDIRSRRPLTVAVGGRSDLAITQLLLDHGAKADVASEKRPPLLEAVRGNQALKATLLLKCGADPRISENSQGMSLLHVAAVKNASPVIIATLIRSGLSINSIDEYGRTPLQLAVEYSSARAVQVLLSHGANPNAKGGRGAIQGKSALFRAVCPRKAHSQNMKILRALLTHGVEVDSKGLYNQTALLYAVSKGALKKAQALLEVGASIKARGIYGMTVLHTAVASLDSSPGMIAWLVENGADVNWVDDRKHETPLFHAIERSQLHPGSERTEIVERLLSLGANVHSQNVKGMVPLSLASKMGSIILSKLLIQHGAFINSRDIRMKSPLHHLFDTKYGNISKKREIARFLIQNGADVNSQDCDGHTPLHIAVATEWTWEIVGELLEAGADRCAMSKDGKFPYDKIPDGPFAETQRLILRHYPV